MVPEEKNPKTFGVSYTYWHGLLKTLCDECQIDLAQEKIDLHKCYHDDLSPKEVYHMLRINTVKAANLTLRWFDAYGRVELQFTNNAQIRHFYKLNPDIKRIMQERKKP